MIVTPLLNSTQLIQIDFWWKSTGSNGRTALRIPIFPSFLCFPSYFTSLSPLLFNNPSILTPIFPLPLSVFYILLYMSFILSIHSHRYSTSLKLCLFYHLYLLCRLSFPCVGLHACYRYRLFNTMLLYENPYY